MESKPCPRDCSHFHLTIAPGPSVYPASELEVTLDKAFLDASAAASRDEDDEDVWLPQFTCVTPVLR